MSTCEQIRHAIIVRLGQSPLFEHDFRTARPAQTVYCHQEFLDKLTARRTEPVGKRTALLMQKMAEDISRLHHKEPVGAIEDGDVPGSVAARDHTSMPGGLP